MSGLKYVAYRGIFELLWASQITHLIRPLSRARGLIFTLHRVLPEPPADFSPNAILQVTPQFLDFAICRVRELGLDIVSMDEAVERIRSDSSPASKFVVFSFDDAYRDNLHHALPVLRKHACPFTLYVPTALVDGVGEVWWQALEDVIAAQDAIAITDDNGELVYHDTRTLSGKQAAYDLLYWRMRKMPEADRVTFIRDFARGYGLNMDAHCRDLIMDWKELRTFVDEDLCTIGAHTVHHFELAKLEADHARQEMDQSRQVINSQYGITPQHLSYPIGATVSAGPREYDMARELGFSSAVTTLPGAIYHHHTDSLMSLPRISLNGLFQKKRYMDVFSTGAIFSLLAKG